MYSAAGLLAFHVNHFSDAENRVKERLTFALLWITLTVKLGFANLMCI
jgi:hypothetical protein